MAGLQQQLGAQLMQAAKIMEEQIDQEMNRLDNLDSDDLEVIRKRRMEELKKAQSKKNEMLTNGHGKYEEVADEKEFFEATKKSNNVVCLFYIPSNFRCKIVDKHFEKLAAKHFQTKFIHINAEKAKFLVDRLNIRVIPTIAVIIDQKTSDYIRGFDDLGGIDDFKTEVLEDRLARTGVITVQRQKPEPKAKKIIRSTDAEYDNEEDWMLDLRNYQNTEAGNWIAVGDAKLKLTNCYKYSTSLPLKNCIYFAACSYSGPIALAYSNSTTTWFITIRLSGGVILKDKIEIPDVRKIFWTRGHRLLVVDRRGGATLFSSLGEKVAEFCINSTIKEIAGVRFFTTTHDSGVAIMDDQHRLFVVNSVNEPVTWTMTIPTKERPTTWTVLQPAKELTRVIVVVGRDFYAGSQGDILSQQDTPWALTEGQYARMAVSPSRLKLAIYHSSRVIQIVSTDLSSEIAKIQVPGQHSIFRFDWIGEDCLFIQSTPQLMQIFNIGDGTACHEYTDDYFHVGVEQDGLKIYNNNSMNYLSVVTHEEKEVLEVATASDGALLHEAAQLLNAGKSHQSYEFAQSIRDLPTAINHCTKVAALCWSPEMQKALLGAARFGLAFVSSFDTSEFVKVIRELRVLNAIRTPRIGIPLTYTQYLDMGPSCLLNRLIDIAQYGTAIEICNWLKGDLEDGVDRVLLEWVRRTIKSAAAEKNFYEMDMDSLEKKIYDKLSQYPHVSIADAAMRAIESNLAKLARLLIKRETDESKQVQVLLQLNDVAEALSRAAAAQKPQLMHQVVRHLMTTMKKAEYELAIHKIPMARIVYENLVREDSQRGPGRQMLALLEQSSDNERLTMLHLDSAQAEINPVERLNCLRQATNAAQALGDQGIADTIGIMASFAPSQYERNQNDMTIRETVIHFAADQQKVNQLKLQGKLTDKQVWLWQIEGLARAGRMEQLFELGQKKCPFGYVPFVKACVQYKKLDEARKYAQKVNGYQNLVQAHLLLENFIVAAKMAFDRRDAETLQSIYAKSHKNPEAYTQVGKLMRAIQQ